MSRTKFALILIAALGAPFALGLNARNPSDFPFDRRMPGSFAGLPSIEPGRLVVGFEPWADRSRFYRETGLTPRRRLTALNVDVVDVPVGQEIARGHEIERRNDVRYAEPDGIAVALIVPNDPLYPQYQWYLPQIRMPDSWDLTTGSTDVTIAILDTGIDFNHPDLKGKIVAGYNATNPGSAPIDQEGHGSHVSGLAAASSDNGIGMTGVNWQARIMPVRVLGPSGQGDTSSIADGIGWAVTHGARIVNMSLGTPVYSSALADAVKLARSKNVLLVASAGNDFLAGNPVSYPGALPGVMAVGASTYLDQRASYSETGSYLSVVAPGGDPFSQTDSDHRHWIVSTFQGAGVPYESLSGTSQSAAIAAGVASLIAGARPDLTADEIRHAIESTAVSGTLSRPSRELGYGRIDAAAALSSVLQVGSLAPPEVALTFPKDGTVVSGSVDVQGSVQGIGIKSYQVEYGIGASPSSWFNLGRVGQQAVRGGTLVRWDTTNLDDGVYSLRLRAMGVNGSSSVTPRVVVAIDNTPPIVTVTSPVEGQSVGPGTVTLIGSIVDAHLHTYSIEIGSGADPGQWTQAVRNEGPPAAGSLLGAVSMTTRAAGVYTFRVTADDLAGNTTIVKTRVVYRSSLPGDANHDGQIDIRDVILILQMSVGLAPIDDVATVDVAPTPGTVGRPYGDGRVTVQDALRVLRYMLRLEPGPWPG